MKILIVDDEPLARERIRELLKNEPQIEFIVEAGDGGEALALIRSTKPDIVFLDIQMPEMDGFEVLEKLDAKQTGAIPTVIFVTAYDQYALRAFEFYAIDYLLKPFDRQRFAETLNLAKERIRQQTGGEYERRMLDFLEKINREPEYLEWLTVKKDERIKLMRADDVCWIEAQGNYVSLQFVNGSEILRETMDKLEAQLNPRLFVRIHRSAIVNISQIAELRMSSRGEYRVIMRDGKTFTLSRGYRSRFDTFLKNSAFKV